MLHILLLFTIFDKTVVAPVGVAFDIVKYRKELTENAQ